ncbi:hypothetical protein TNCT_285531 [Trichonephila clavata]|uniref:Uncharacterized protein n=1 Tax=Trichonephila clavata TaxID=2740835 RepID=A0A8X6GMB0_TRICU|nr:hypothetical protein TNCT_285531 [Trichonephila clavata]
MHERSGNQEIARTYRSVESSPFSISGVDIAGPFHKDGDKHLLLCICAATRALHLRTSSFNTEQFCLLADSYPTWTPVQQFTQTTLKLSSVLVRTILEMYAASSCARLCFRSWYNVEILL